MRICHLSDLHFGHHDTHLADGLMADLTSQSPDLVVVSGDFTQLGTEGEFATARAFLDTLQTPFFAVPGNHDVPARNVLKRLVDPYGLYRRYISQELEPTLDLGNIVIAGLRTSRRLRAELNWAHGSLSRGQLARLEERFAATSPTALRIVVAHHPLMQPEGDVLKPMRLVRRADLALETFAKLGVRLVLSGHFHLSYVRQHGTETDFRTTRPARGGPCADPRRTGLLYHLDPVARRYERLQPHRYRERPYYRHRAGVARWRMDHQGKGLRSLGGLGRLIAPRRRPAARRELRTKQEWCFLIRNCFLDRFACCLLPPSPISTS